MSSSEDDTPLANGHRVNGDTKGMMLQSVLLSPFGLFVGIVDDGCLFSRTSRSSHLTSLYSDHLTDTQCVLRKIARVDGENSEKS